MFSHHVIKNIYILFILKVGMSVTWENFCRFLFVKQCLYMLSVEKPNDNPFVITSTIC